MTEVLTESFCERCGTRYTFETVQQRGRPLSRLTTLGRGLQHFIVQGDSSFDEAMAVARSEAEQRVTTAQLEAFHRTFNFCLSCRQYTCRECWNAVEGRCLSCAPMPVQETLAPATILATSTPVAIAPPPVAAAAAPIAEPEAAPPEPQPEPEPIAEVVAEAEPEPEPIAEVAQEPGPLPEAAPEPIAEPGTPELAVEPFPGFQPGRSLDDEIAAYEVRMAALAQIPLDPGPPIPQEPEPAPRIAAAAAPPAAIQPAQQPAPPSLQVVGTAQPAAGEPAVAGAPGTCRSCGLSISASARFCRRCGTRQAA